MLKRHQSMNCKHKPVAGGQGNRDIATQKTQVSAAASSETAEDAPQVMVGNERLR